MIPGDGRRLELAKQKLMMTCLLSLVIEALAEIVKEVSWISF